MEKDNKCCCAASREPSEKKEADVLIEKNKQLISLENMVRLPGDTFLMGSDDPDSFVADGEGPIREVFVDSFFIDATTVTNQQFAEFINSTGYKTDAEKYGWSFVFKGLLPENLQEGHFQFPPQTPWWLAVPGAQWNHPEGTDSGIEKRIDHPVVHVSWNDANAYCKWSGKRLPTEAEWEYAARGGMVQKRFPWGNELTPGGKHQCNIWQGTFPDYNSVDDGYLGTAPAKSFDPNGFGLYNMSGNVWEWCNDWFDRDFHLSSTIKNPAGPLHGIAKVMRGGSFLCHHSYCNRYRVAARSSNTPDSSTSNIGFRCVVSA